MKVMSYITVLLTLANIECISAVKESNYSNRKFSFFKYAHRRQKFAVYSAQLQDGC